MISWWIMYHTVPTLPQKPKKVLGFLDTKMDRPWSNHNVLNGIEFLIIELVPKLYIPTPKCDGDHFLIRWSFQTIGFLFIKMKGSIENFIRGEGREGAWGWVKGLKSGKTQPPTPFWTPHAPHLLLFHNVFFCCILKKWKWWHGVHYF